MHAKSTRNEIDEATCAKLRQNKDFITGELPRVLDHFCEEPVLAARRDAVATSKLLVGALEILQAEVDRIKHQVGVSCPRSEERTAAEKELQDLRDLLEATRVRCLGLSSLKRKVRRSSSA